jgi:putative SOS response-associated peptidase YedK
VTKKKDVVWFALNDDRPLFAFAGIWTEFKGDRGTKSKPIPGPHLVYGFLTTAPNAIVETIHPKVMPVILRTEGNATLGCAHHGTRPRMTRSRLSAAAPTKKTGRRPEEGRLQAPRSVIQSRQTGRTLVPTVAGLR